MSTTAWIVWRNVSSQLATGGSPSLLIEAAERIEAQERPRGFALPGTFAAGMPSLL